jgi:hypothetical protein
MAAAGTPKLMIGSEGRNDAARPVKTWLLPGAEWFPETFALAIV